MAGAAGPGAGPGAAGGDGDDSLYPIAVLIDELRNEDVQVLGWGWGAEASSEAYRVGKSGKAGSAMGAAPGTAEPYSALLPTGPGAAAAAAPRWSASAPGSPTSAFRGLRRWGGEPVPASGGRAAVGCGAARERRSGPGDRGPFEVLWSVCLGWQTGPAGWVGRAPQLINPDEWCISCDGTFL